MNILIVDDEKAAIENLKEVLEEIFGDNADLSTANRAEKALKIVEESQKPFDVAFLDIEMPKMSGLELAVKIKDMSPKTDIIMVTAYSEYALDALRLHVSDYLLKPATPDDVQRALDNLSRQEEKKETEPGMLKVICFGNFEVFAGDKPVTFKRSRTKELFAYLVDRRGAACTMGELMGVLYEDENSDSRKSWMRMLIQDMRKTFEALGMGDVIIKAWNTVAVNTSMLDCDYYKMLDGSPAALNDYYGEYMTQYSWAEMSLRHI